MSLYTIRRRLDRLEADSRPSGLRGAVRIVSHDDADTARQRADLAAAGRLGPGIMLIDFRIVSPRWEKPR